jgi:hypothetical protein
MLPRFPRAGEEDSTRRRAMSHLTFGLGRRTCVDEKFRFSLRAQVVCSYTNSAVKVPVGTAVLTDI